MENYFNYFTEIEERFLQRRGGGLLLSTLDWALIETWKDAGIPLEAVLRGIDEAFDQYDQRPSKTKKVNSLAYCSQLVLAAAEDMKEAAVGAAVGRTVACRNREPSKDLSRKWSCPSCAAMPTLLEAANLPRRGWNLRQVRSARYRKNPSRTRRGNRKEACCRAWKIWSAALPCSKKNCSPSCSLRLAMKIWSPSAPKPTAISLRTAVKCPAPRSTNYRSNMFTSACWKNIVSRA